MGLREDNKAEKLRRIKDAARQLFTERGYDATSTREIAELASVSVGTVFFYARDKGDLVCLMAVDRLERQFARAFRACDPAQPFLDQLVSVCTHMFKDAARNVSLSRILIKEMVAYRNKHRIDEWVNSSFERLLNSAVATGEVRFTEEPAFVARAIGLCYLAEMRDWIMLEKPLPASGVASLRRTFTLLLQGLNYQAREAKVIIERAKPGRKSSTPRSAAGKGPRQTARN